MSVICSMQAGSRWHHPSVGFGDIVLFAFAYGRRGFIVLEIEAPPQPQHQSDSGIFRTYWGLAE